ncbi:hypothetical protein Tco_1275641 [Tanacetum coccineum]
MFSLVWIMPPRMTTRSAGRPAVASQGGGTGGRAGRGSGRTRSRSGDQGNGRNDGQGGQVGDQCRGQGNGRNQNDNAINDNIRGDVRNVIENNDRKGCSYKEFLACNPKEYDGKGGVVVYTRWIEKMESVQDMSGCGDNQKVKYTAGSFAKLETELWNHTMVRAGHAVYTDRFHGLASTAGAEVSTGTHDVSTAAVTLVYIMRSASIAKDKGKAIIQEPKPPKKLKKRV